MQDSTPSNRQDAPPPWSPLLLLPVLAILIGLYHLHLFLAGDTEVLHPSEPLRLWDALHNRDGWPTGPQLAQTGLHTSCLYYVLQLPVLLFDNLLVGVHVTYAAFKFICIGLWLYWGTRYVKHWPVVWIAAIFLAMDDEAPGFHFENQTIACYLSFLLFMSVVVGVRNRHPLALAPAGLIFAVLKEVHLYGLMLLPCVGLSLLLGQHHRGRNIGVFIASMGLATLVFVLLLGGYTYEPWRSDLGPLSSDGGVASMLGGFLLSVRFELYGPLALGGFVATVIMLLTRRKPPRIALHAAIWLPLLHVCLSGVSAYSGAVADGFEFRQHRWFALADGQEAVFAALAVFGLCHVVRRRFSTRPVPGAWVVASCVLLCVALSVQHGLAAHHWWGQDARNSPVFWRETAAVENRGTPFNTANCKNSRILDDVFMDELRSEDLEAGPGQEFRFYGLCQDTLSHLLRWAHRGSSDQRLFTRSSRSTAQRYLLLPRLGDAEERLLPAAASHGLYVITPFAEFEYLQQQCQGRLSVCRQDLGTVGDSTVVLQARTDTFGRPTRNMDDAWLEQEGLEPIRASLIYLMEGTHWMFFEVTGADPRRVHLAFQSRSFENEGLTVYMIPHQAY